ncbi:hypothetical protein [Methyloglobulus sp.]|uniref:hypothetical protein n=1 Tax=Methyloglobulus sp. TaxID=2518622 RepID=UPI00398A320B
MNFRYILAALMLSLFSLGVVNAAGQPINEDFTALIALAEKMIAAGKASDTSGFVDAASEASAVAKDQGMKGNSITVQRVSTKFKVAKKAVKSGDFAKGIKEAEEAIVEMKKEKPALNFGGGSEKRPNSLY